MFPLSPAIFSDVKIVSYSNIVFTMDLSVSVQRAPSLSRPYGGLRSPYKGSHPSCSVLCQHPTAPPTHRTLLAATRSAWVTAPRLLLPQQCTKFRGGKWDHVSFKHIMVFKVYYQYKNWVIESTVSICKFYIFSCNNYWRGQEYLSSTRRTS